MPQNGVIDKDKGDLLRCGYCDFSKESGFDPSKEEMRKDVPVPGYCRDTQDPEETQMHRWSSAKKVWLLVPKKGAAVPKAQKPRTRRSKQGE